LPAPERPATSRPLDPRARKRLDQLVSRLALAPHPEGGRFRQIFRSASQVRTADNRPLRTAMTSIYYLLEEGEFGRWHRVRSDEVWHLYEGGPLELLVAPPDVSAVEHRVLDAAGPDTEPVTVVPADWWQAARPLGAYALAGCTVAPGFEFDDFAFLSDEPLAMERFAQLDRDYRLLL
jgi:uncharacterized protein